MIGFGATGAAEGATLGPDDGAALPAGADAAGADAAGAGTTGAARWKPTTRPRIWSTDVSSPMVDTGTFEPSAGSWPEGKVRLLAWRTPTICWLVIVAAAILAGSSVMKTRSSRPPVTSARATPSIPRISGTISVRAICATSWRPSDPLAAIDEMTTGEALMLSAWTVGWADAGRLALAIASVMACVVALTSVPNENWVTTSEIELDEVDWMVSSRGTPLIAFSIGFVTCSVTSDEPAPG